MLKKGTPASPATARANNVFPVPGGPYRRIPFGTFAPSRSNRFGWRRKSTTSISSARASSTPATSSKLTDEPEFACTCAGLTRGMTCSVFQRMKTMKTIRKKKASGSQVTAKFAAWCSQCPMSGTPH